jgi:O-antigen/teichoic acid export membrane protein
VSRAVKGEHEARRTPGTEVARFDAAGGELPATPAAGPAELPATPAAGPAEPTLRASGSAAVLLGIVSAVNLLGNVIFHTIVARHTDVKVYGAIAVLLSFGAAASVLGSGVQFAVARRVARPGASVEAEMRAGLRSCAVPLLATAVACAAAEPLAHYLHLATAGAVLLSVGYVAATILAAVPSGVLVGTSRYKTLAAVAMIGIVTRILLVLPFRWGGNSETLALATSMTGTLLVAALSTGIVWIGATRSRPRSSQLAPREFAPAESAPTEIAPTEIAPTEIAPTEIAPTEIADDVPHELAVISSAKGGDTRTEGAAGAALGGLLWMSWFLAIVFARHYLPARAAGQFSVAHVAASGILFLTSAVSTAFFPALVRTQGRRAVLVGLLATIGTALAAAAGLTGLGRLLLGLLYGQAFPPGWALFLALSASASLVSVATYVLWASRARQRHTSALWVAVVVAVVLELVLALLAHGSSYLLAVEPGISAVVAAVAAAVAVSLKSEPAGVPVSP